jgi:hypothetical protein
LLLIIEAKKEEFDKKVVEDLEQMHLQNKDAHVQYDQLQQQVETHKNVDLS